VKPSGIRPTVIKLGGAALRDEKVVSGICRELASLQATFLTHGAPLVIVHGGGPAINEELTSKGITWEFVRGQRVTTDAMMDVIETVLSGKVNKSLVRALNHSQVRAVGLSGTDARMLQCKALSPEMGRVGEIMEVDTSAIHAILNAGLTPVIAPIGVGPLEGEMAGQAFNINADFAACRIAEVLGAEKLVFLTDQDGILDSDKKLISEISSAGLSRLIESGVVQGGMLAKTQTILHALSHGVSKVQVLNGCTPHVLTSATPVGTLCHA
jgi:acetylglutamate kinase